MNMLPPAEPCWRTASIGCAADTTPMELRALEEHLNLCQSLRGRLFGVRCHTDALRGFMAAHVMTSVFAAALLIGLGWLLA